MSRLFSSCHSSIFLLSSAHTRAFSTSSEVLCRRLGLRYPLIQSPMAGSQDYQLCAAVSQQGCLGSLPCAMQTVAEVRQQVSLIQQRTTAAAAGGQQKQLPLNLNFFCHTLPPRNLEKEQAWAERLKTLAHAIGAPSPTVNSKLLQQAPSRLPFDDSWMPLLEEIRPCAVSFHFGLPHSTIITSLKKLGIFILSTATTVDEGDYLVQHGVDAIIGQGIEAGGHRGHFLHDDLSKQLTTFTLIPQLIQRFPHIPIIAAGGICDASTIHAIMSFGTAGVQIGTRFLLAHEATTSFVHRQALLDTDRAKHTALTNIFSGRPARGIVNVAMQELGYLHPDAPSFPYAQLTMASLRKQAESTLSGDFSPLWAGQNTSSCKNQSAAEIIQELVKGFQP